MFLNLAVGSPALLNQLSLVMLDEAQFIIDPNRGGTVGLLLTHLLAARGRASPRNSSPCRPSSARSETSARGSAPHHRQEAGPADGGAPDPDKSSVQDVIVLLVRSLI